jgi:hypothetical protein
MKYLGLFYSFNPVSGINYKTANKEQLAERFCGFALYQCFIIYFLLPEFLHRVTWLPL